MNYLNRKSFMENGINVKADRECSTFVELLKDCAKRKDAHKGSMLHANILKRGLLERSPYVASTLISMYAKCGMLTKAQQVLHQLMGRDVVCWNALIAGYTQYGQGHEAMKCFELMEKDGIYPNAVTFTSILKACGSMGAISKGKQIHDEIMAKGLLEKNVMLGNALVDMYAKCGMLTKAQEVLQQLPVRDEISWNSLICGYTQHGQGHEALNCFELMQKDGICPDMITFTCVLKACASTRAIEKGKQIHEEILRRNLVGESHILDCGLIDMYIKCGVLTKAQQVLDELPHRNTASWNTLISGYIQHGYGSEALRCYEYMENEGICPNAITFGHVLKACGSTRDVEKGQEIHDKIVISGLIEKHYMLGSALVDMYAKCGILTKSQDVLDQLLVRDIICWNSLISGYVHEGEPQKAMVCFERMQGEGLFTDAVTFTCILRACGSSQAINKGKHIHYQVNNRGSLYKDIVLGTSLLDMYAKCGMLSKAQQVHDELPLRDSVSWSALIGGYAQHGKGNEALNCFEEMQKDGHSPNMVTFISLLKACGSVGAIGMGEKIHHQIANKGLLDKNIVLNNALLDMYVKCGMVLKAQEVFDKLHIRNVVSWSALIAGYAEHGEGYEALTCYEKMQKDGISADAVMFTCILKACGKIGAVDKGKQIHDKIASRGLLDKNLMLGNALVDMYAKCSLLEKAEEVVHQLPIRDVVSWNALISGYIHQGKCHEALDTFEKLLKDGVSPDDVTFTCILNACGTTGAITKGKRIHDEIASRGLLNKNVVLGTSLVDMYVKWGMLEKAQNVLDELPTRDVVAWSALIAGYAQQEQGHEALKCFEQMQREGISPNSVTLTCVLKACGSTGAIDKGESIHDEVVSRGFLEKNVMLGNALVDMYVKFGMLAKAHRVLNDLPLRDVVTWSALITGYAQKGQCHEALECFDQMQRDGISPNAVTILCVLNACSQSGLIDKAQMYFENMTEKYGIMPCLEHHTCMVEVFGSAGHFDRAMSVIEKMPSSDNPPIWLTLLSACRKWVNVKYARLAFDRAVQLDSTNPVQYVLMSKIYVAAGMLEDAAIVDTMRAKHSASKKLET